MFVRKKFFFFAKFRKCKAQYDFVLAFAMLKIFRDWLDDGWRLAALRRCKSLQVCRLIVKQRNDKKILPIELPAWISISRSAFFFCVTIVFVCLIALIAQFERLVSTTGVLRQLYLSNCCLYAYFTLPFLYLLLLLRLLQPTGGKGKKKKRALRCLSWQN